MSRAGRRWLAWLTTAVVVVLCLLPRSFVAEGKSHGPKLIPHADKVVHFSMFAAFGYFWMASTSTRSRRSASAAAVLAAGFALAVATELLQGLPAIDRDPDVLDGLADAAGAVAGVVFVRARPDGED
jgi:VanZ family protein